MHACTFKLFTQSYLHFSYTLSQEVWLSLSCQFLYHLMLQAISYSLPAQNAVKGMSSHATGFACRNECLCNHLIILQFSVAYEKQISIFFWIFDAINLHLFNQIRFALFTSTSPYIVYMNLLYIVDMLVVEWWLLNVVFLMRSILQNSFLCMRCCEFSCAMDFEHVWSHLFRLLGSTFICLAACINQSQYRLLIVFTVTI